MPEPGCAKLAAAGV